MAAWIKKDMKNDLPLSKNIFRGITHWNRVKIDGIMDKAKNWILLENSQMVTKMEDGS